MSEITHLASIFNKGVKELVSPILPNTPWGIEVSLEISKSGIDTASATDALIKSTLSNVTTPEEIEGFLELVHEFREVESPKEIEVIAQNFFKFYKDRTVSTILSSNMDDVDNLINELRDIPMVLSSHIKPENLAGMDPDTVMEEDIGGAEGRIESSLDIVKESSAFDAYLPGWVVQWVGRPGGGKSAAMLQECLYAAAQDKSVIWFALGDLMRFDFLTRSLAVTTQTPYAKVVGSFKKMYTNPDHRDGLKNIDLVAKPSRSLSAEEIHQFLESCGKRYDIVVIDYDSNLKRPETGNMYDDGGHIYDILTAIARPENEPNRLVHVASQPKIQYWGDEELEIESAGESARKQQNIDMMITAGLNANSDKHCGIIKVAKARRGKDNVKSAWYMTDYGEIREIDQEMYSRMRGYGGSSRR